MELIYSNKIGQIWLVEISNKGQPYYRVRIHRNGKKRFTTNIKTAHQMIKEFGE